jgi:hypothetical protein
VVQDGSEPPSAGGVILIPREHPILFSRELMPAVMDGTKTQTRRVINCACNTIHQTDAPRLLGDWGLSVPPYRWDGTSKLWRLSGPEPKPGDWIEEYQTDVDDNATAVVRCPYGSVGDALRALTTWAVPKRWDIFRPLQVPRWTNFWHAGLGDKPSWAGKSHPGRFCPSFMRCLLPLLEITDIRVERCQAITEADAIAEGFTSWTHRTEGEITACRQFFELWDKINGNREDYAWESNPLCWCITFKRMEVGA